MSKILHQEMEKLKRDLLFLGSLVKEAVEKSISAFYDCNKPMAENVIEDDQKVDQKEVDIEQSCLQILALHQPVAEDLRFIASVMKINSDLERMGDSAVSIARRAVHYAERNPISLPSDLREMSQYALSMVQDSLSAFVNKDVTVAHEVCRRDKEVDERQAQMFRKLKEIMKEDSEMVSVSLDVFTITKRLERIADLATNICEDVIYMVEGKIIRHKRATDPKMSLDD